MAIKYGNSKGNYSLSYFLDNGKKAQTSLFDVLIKDSFLNDPP